MERADHCAGGGVRQTRAPPCSHGDETTGLTVGRQSHPQRYKEKFVLVM